MEIKYEAVFGDQSLLAEAGTFTGLDVVVRNVDTDLYRIARKTSPFTARMNSATAKPFCLCLC